MFMYYRDIEKPKTCKCCGGTGVQYNKKTGLVQPCPYCKDGITETLPKRIEWLSCGGDLYEL